MPPSPNYIDEPYYHTNAYQTPFFHLDPPTEKPSASDFLPPPSRTPPSPRKTNSGMFRHHHDYDPFRRSQSVEPPPDDDAYRRAPGSGVAPDRGTAKAAKRTHKHELKTMHAELQIALGMKTLVEERARQRGSRSRSRSRGRMGALSGEEGPQEGMGEMMWAAEHLLEGAVAKGGERGGRKSGVVVSGGLEMGMQFLEEQVEERASRRAARRSSSMPPASPTTTSSPMPLRSAMKKNSGRAGEVVAGAAGLAALAGAPKYLEDRMERRQDVRGGSSPGLVPRKPKTRKSQVEAVLAAVAIGGATGLGVEYLEDRAHRRRSRRDDGDGGRSAAPPGVRGVPTSVPLGISNTPVPQQARSKTFLSELSKSEHWLLQHAAASLLLREPEIMQVVGNFNGMVQLLEKEKTPTGGYTEALFGVSLNILMKYEATDSHHGVGPGTIKVPTFVDHCITALMEMDVTVQGILRKSGNLHQLAEVVNALDHAGGDGYTVDLSGLDPVTLASLFKRFLGMLPDSVCTGRLFGLFLTASKIKNPSARKRTMHLVVCMMPKTNRDVFEVVFLFLDWLSTYAHININIGNGMDLSNIAKVMAPTLLRPAHRDPHPTEISAMISTVLLLLEDQHILHEIPFELSRILHIQPPETKDSRTLLHRFQNMF